MGHDGVQAKLHSHSQYTRSEPFPDVLVYDPASQVQISSAYQLSSAYPVYGYQEEAPLTICFPHDCSCFASLSESLLIQTRRFT